MKKFKNNRVVGILIFIILSAVYGFFKGVVDVYDVLHRNKQWDKKESVLVDTLNGSVNNTVKK